MLALGILGVHISSIVVGAPLNVSDSAENNATGDSSSSNGTFFNSNGTSIMPGCLASSPEENIIDPLLALYVFLSVASLIALVLWITCSFTVVTRLVRPAPNRFTVYMCAMAVLDSITLCLTLFTMIRFEDHLLYRVTLTFQAFSNWILTAICLERYVSIQLLFPTFRNFSWKKDGPGIVIIFIMYILFFSGQIGLGFKNIYSIQRSAGIEFVGLIMLFLLVITSLLVALNLKQNARYRKPMMSAWTSRRSITLETQLARMTVVSFISSVVFLSFHLALSIFFATQMCSRQDTVARNWVSVFFLFLFWFTSCVNPALHFYTYYSCAQRFRDKRSKPRDIEFLRDGCLRQS